ncbi:DUF2478 domain-containing protein [Pusillimonas sp. SM2304]|uniref:DUF2478 domain-containing protein n=1 Tax=Pusillimonas sp. SM2304 TaxID=3073241 RepID=UPI002876C08A|nr:DUF2478 domain-containing protein [Pusillimonas sp. SM2304]MDS1140779.1 DUF2478 domain-containing protein [Pusillimonas sp. SM2304]
MKLGYVSLRGRGRIDLLLAEIVEQLEAHGVALAGTVQTNIHRHDRPACDMDLRLLPDGPVLRISIDRGAQARGCRLDAGALEQSALWVSGALERAELLVVNKFGKREAEGKGLTGVIADALERGLPVLVGVNGLNLPAFLEFAGGAATEVAPDAGQATGWCLAALSRTIRSKACGTDTQGKTAPRD